MTSGERKKYILKTAAADGMVSIPAVATHFGVSVETIRRDVNALVEDKKLEKVHGGAVPKKKAMKKSHDTQTPHITEKEAKAEVGACAAKLIANGDVVILDGSEPVQNLANFVDGLLDVTFITNSVDVALVLSDRCEKGAFTGRVILIGGEVNCHTKFTCTAGAVEQLSKYHADKAFISATAVSADGASVYDTGESSFLSKIMDRAACSILVAESAKFGKNSLYNFSRLDDFDYIITDGMKKLPHEITDRLNKCDTVLKIS